MTRSLLTPLRNAREVTHASPVLSAMGTGTLVLVGALLAILALASSDPSPPPAPREPGLEWDALSWGPSSDGPNGVLVFDGNSAVILGSTLPEAGDFTAECWVRAQPATSAGTVFGNAGYGGMSFEWAYPGLSLTTPSAWVNVDHVPGTRRSGYVIAEMPETPSVSVWHHVAVVFERDVLRLYLDGACVARATTRGARRSGSRRFALGARIGEDGAAHSCFLGQIDNFRLSSVARYDGTFTPSLAFEPDGATVSLLTFDDALRPRRDLAPGASEAGGTGNAYRAVEPRSLAPR